MSVKEIADAIYSVFPFTRVEMIEDKNTKSTSIVIRWYYKGCEYGLNRFIRRDYPKETAWRLIQNIVEEIARSMYVAELKKGDAGNGEH